MNQDTDDFQRTTVALSECFSRLKDMTLNESFGLRFILQVLIRSNQEVMENMIRIRNELTALIERVLKCHYGARMGMGEGFEG